MTLLLAAARSGENALASIPIRVSVPIRMGRRTLLRATALATGVIAAMLVFKPAPAKAQNNWVGTSGTWNTGSNWSLGTVPYQGDDVVISTYQNNPPVAVFQVFSKSVLINLPLAGIPQPGFVAADTVTFNQGAGNAGSLAQWIVTDRFSLQSGRFINNSDLIPATGYVKVTANDFLVGPDGVFENRGSISSTQSALLGANIANSGSFYNTSNASISGVVLNTAGTAGADGLPNDTFGPQADKRQFYNAGSISGGVVQAGQMPIFAVTNSGYFWNDPRGAIYGGVENKAGGLFRNQNMVKGDVFVSGGTFVNGEFQTATDDIQGFIQNGVWNGQPVVSKLTVGAGGTFINRRGTIEIAVDNQGTFTNHDELKSSVVSSGTFNNIKKPAGTFGFVSPTIGDTVTVNGGSFKNEGTIYGLVTVNGGTFANEGSVNGINVEAGGTVTNSGTTSQILVSPGGVAETVNVSGRFRNLNGGQIGTAEFISYAFNNRPTFVNVTAGGAFTNEAGAIVRSSVTSAGSSASGAINGNFGTIQGDLTINGGNFIQAGTLHGSASVAATGTLIFGGLLNNVHSDGNLAANLNVGLSTFSNDGAVVFDVQSRDKILLGRIFGTGTVENRGGGLSGGVTFDADQGYTGKTMVTGGFIAFNKGYSSTLFEVSGGASVIFNNSDPTVGKQFSGTVTGAGNFIKGGAGTLTINSVLANTGTVAANGGLLNFGANGGIAQTAVLATDNNGQIALGSSNLIVGGIRAQTGKISGTGNIEIKTAANTTNQYSGVIEGAGRSITKTGTGMQELYGVNTYDGGTTIKAGVLKVGSSNALGTGTIVVEAGGNLELGTLGNFVLPNSGSDFTFDKVITGAGGLIKTSSNTVTLTAANTYTGDTYVREGTLKLGGTGKIALASKIIVSSGAKFDIGNTSFATNTLTNLGGDLVGGGGTLTLNFTTPETYSGKISDGVGLGDTFRLALTGGTLTLSGNNSFTGGIVISGHGTKLILDHNNAAGGINNKIYTQGTVITYNNGVNNGSGIVISSNTTQLEVNGTDSATQSGVISEDQAGRPLEKIGTGTLTLSAANTYSGRTTISAGTLKISAANNLGSDTSTNSVALNGGTLDTTGATVTMNRSLSVTNAGGTITTDQNLTFQGSNVFLGTLTKVGTGILTLEGSAIDAGGINVTAGILALGNSNAAGSGTITLATGTRLRGLTNGMNIANNIALTGGSATLERSGTANYTLSGVISGTGSLLKSQDGIIDLTGKNTFTGGVTLGAGTLGVGSNTALGTGLLTAEINTTLRAVANVTLANNIQLTLGKSLSNQFTVDTNGYNMTLSGVISTNVPQNELNQPGLTKNGAGTLTLSGTNTYRGATIVNAGTLVVNGSIANTSSVTIANGAKLGGNAAIPNLTVQNGATISPGNSIGTVNITGNLTLNPGSTTIIEIQQNLSDRIIAGGTASIAGTLQLVALGGPYVFATPYTIITSTGARTGTFSTVNTDAAFGVGVTSTVLYGSNNVQVVLNAAPLAQTATTLALTRPKNVFAVASGMDRAVAAGADASAFFNVYNQPTREALAAAVNTLSGEVHTAANAMGIRASDQFMRVMLDPFALGRDTSLMNVAGGGFGDVGALQALSAPAPRIDAGLEPFIAQAPMQAQRFAVWGAAYGQTARVDGDAFSVGTSRLSASDGHIAVGADMALMPGMVAGLAVSGGQGSARLANGLGSAKADIYQVGAYTLGKFGALSFGLSGSYGSLQTETNRAIPVLGIAGLKGSYRAESWSGRAEAAYALTRLAGFGFSPIAAIQAQSVKTPGFVETNSATGLGAGVASLSKTNATVRSELGLKLDYVAVVGGSTVNLYASAAWAHYYARDTKFAGSLVGLAGSAFTIEGARPAREAAIIAVGADMKLGPNMHLGARFDTELGGKSSSYAGSAKLRMGF